MRDWWLRTLLVLQRPRPVFVALRDDDPDLAAERGEPVLLIVWLAGIAAVLAGSTTYLDDGSRDGSPERMSALAAIVRLYEAWASSQHYDDPRGVRDRREPKARFSGPDGESSVSFGGSH
jgi:hypothetical protein